ncbi:MFS transporter [Pseudoxanthomonas beigongshangi]
MRDTSPPPLQLLPLILVNAACMMAMNAFIALLGPLARTLELAEWQAGASVTVAGVLWFLLARRWGRLSDRLGRKRVIVTGIVGFALSCLALAVGIHWALLTAPGALIGFLLLLAGRGAIGAFFAAVPAAANAMVADRTSAERRTAAMATLGASSAIGLVLGPSLAGWLVGGGLVLPLYAMAGLAILALIIALTGLSAGHAHVPPAAPSVRMGDPRLRIPVVVAFVAMGSVAIAQICVGFYAMDRWGLSREHAGRVAGHALTAVGIALIAAQLGVRRLQWPPRTLIRRGAGLAMLGFLVAGFTTASWQLIASYFVMALGMGLVFPAFSAMAANAVAAHEQGAAAGTVSAAQGMGMVLGPLLGALLYGIAPAVPFVTGAALLALVALWIGGARDRSVAATADGST